MRSTVITRLATAFLMTSTIGAAQTAPPPSQPATPSTAKPMMIVGCLKSTPNPDPAGSVGKPPIYTMEVMPAPTLPPPTPSASTPTGMPSASGSGAVKPTVYSLTASESVGLVKHVGHRVELTGSLQQVTPPTPGRAGTGTQPMVTPGAKPEEQESKPGGAHNTFEVTAVKMVSAQCTPAP